MRQFYDEVRSFRVTGGTGTGYEFMQISNAQLKDQVIGADSMGIPLYRRPVFDIKIKAQKKNPFARMEQNERAKELYSMGFFNPERAQESLAALDMMDFEGIDKVREYVQQGQTLLNICMQLQQENAALKMAIAGAAAVTGAPGAPNPGTAPKANAAPPKGLASAVSDAQTPMTGYQQRLAARSAPSVTGS
jgi:hypothetical protein